MLVGQLWLMFAAAGITPTQGSGDPEVYYMSEMCGSTIDMTNKNSHAGEIRFQGLWEHADDNTCEITVIPSMRYNRIAFQFKDAPVIKRGCIHIGQDGVKFCRKTPPKVGQVNVTQTGTHLIVQYKQKKRKGSEIETSFSILFNTFFNDGSCKRDYECDNGRCIDETLNCNGHNPCGDHSDCRSTGLSSGKIAGIVIGVVLVVILWLCCIVRRECYAAKDSEFEQREDSLNRNSWSDGDNDVEAEITHSRRNSWQDMQERRTDVPREPTIVITPSAPAVPSNRYLSRSAHEINAPVADEHFGHTLLAAGSRSHNGLNTLPFELPPPSYDDVIADVDKYKITNKSRSTNDLNV